jgi:hypothetical protein
MDKPASAKTGALIVPSLGRKDRFPIKKSPACRGAFSYLVIVFGGAVEPEGSAVPLLIAVPLVPDVDVA